MVSGMMRCQRYVCTFRKLNNAGNKDNVVELINTVVSKRETMQHVQIEYKCSLPIYSVINRAQINVCVQSADDFSERSLRMAEVSRDQRNLEEEVEEDGSPVEANKGEEGHDCFSAY